jgi:predicted Zn-dependent protease
LVIATMAIAFVRGDEPPARPPLTMQSLAPAAIQASVRAAAPDQAALPPLVGILSSELQRNFDGLKAQAPPLYYLAYTVHDRRTTHLSASFGAITDRLQSRDRALSVEARVGDYGLDSTHQIRGDWDSVLGSSSRTGIPLTDNEAAIRQAAWRATDRQYKRAAERYTKVRANIAGKVQEESRAPDFSREALDVSVTAASFAPIDLDAWAARLRRVSAPFADDPLIFRGSVTLMVEADLRDFVNSEGTRLQTARTQADIVIAAAMKADDGMELPLTTTYSVSSLDRLPLESQLLADVRATIDLLRRLRTAPLVEPYSGPAVLSGRASAVFFHEIFGHRVEGHRMKDADEGQTFARKIGERVLPPFITVISDPTLDNLGGVPLVGHYDYDDEGVKAQRVVVVDKGILRNFLLSRSPLDESGHSNGHGRAAPGLTPVSRQSNLLIQSARSVPDLELVEQLKAECRRQGKPFGLLFDNIEGGQTYTGRESPNAFNVVPTVVYRIYLDGRPAELVRGVDLIGTPLAAFGKILATGTEVGIFNGYCGAESGFVPVSASSPALLVSEVEVQKKPQSQETSPILKAPERRKK